MASPNPIIGLYGIPGCGKSFLLQQLQHQLGQQYRYYEGSQVIADVVPGGLSAFHASSDAQKTHWRRLAINHIRDSSLSTDKPALVAGHFMFWSEGDDAGQVVCTPDDLLVYTHVIYLDTPIATVASRRDGDQSRARPFQSQAHLQKWQEAEKAQLRKVCMDNSILFIALRSPETIPDLIRNFGQRSVDLNVTLAKARLEDIFRRASLARGPGAIKTVVILDADRTLAPFDSGSLFWEIVGGGAVRTAICPLKTLFGSRMGYSLAAFRQAALLYEEIIRNESKDTFESYCRQVASKIHLYSEFTDLLRSIAQDKSVLPIIITCGVGEIWGRVLHDTLGAPGIDVVGTGTMAEGFVVTPEVKADLVDYLRQIHAVRIWAVGDSVLDIPMMIKADQAVVVVGCESVRSKSMESALAEAIDQHGLRAVQVLLPSNEAMKPRLDITKLPVVRFKGVDLFDLRIRQPIGTNSNGPSFMHATDRAAAKLLMTPTRDASSAGPTLREAHRQVGRYLALEFVSEIVGLETYATPHVQNRPTEGYRLRCEAKTAIVALMRGGEPMALGVNEVFPLSLFVHAKEPADLKPHHLAGQETVILVDSVVNSGKSVIDFVRHIRGPLASGILIVVIVGVAQADSVKRDGALAKCLGQDEKLRVVALRLSENKYTGRGGTDTGNRLFNTTHLD